MATAIILPLPRFVAYDPRTGAPLVGGQVRTFIPGTATSKLTYQDEAQTLPNPNPATLDSAGSMLLYGTGSYSLVTTDSLGNQIPGYSGVVDVGGGSGGGGAVAPDPDIGRNKLHNGLFNITQRGLGPFGGASVYTADRWLLQTSGDTSSITIFPADRQPVGDEETTNMCLFSVIPLAGAGSFSLLCQRIEKVRRLSGQTVTVSFNAGGDNVHIIGVSIDQVFGTGGSPSASVLGAGQSVTVVNYTGFDRYSLTFNVPSALGKTLGSNGDDYTQVNIWGSSGATNATRAGNIGAVVGSRYICDVQLEIGSHATPMEKLSPRIDLANCQRFFQTGILQNFGSVTSGGISVILSNLLPVVMRATPTIGSGFSVASNMTGVAVTAVGGTSIAISGTSVAGGGYGLQASFTASADL